MHTVHRHMNRLPLLSGAESYITWSEALVPYLKIHSIWRIVSGAHVRPTTSTPPSTQEPSSTEHYEETVTEWEVQNDKVIGLICSTVSPHIRHEVIHIISAKDLWEELKGRDHLVADMRSFWGLRMAIATVYEDCNGVRDYISRMSAALDRLSAGLRADERLPEMFRVHSLLCKLGDDWGMFLASYFGERFDRETVTYDEVSRALIREEMRMDKFG